MKEFSWAFLETFRTPRRVCSWNCIQELQRAVPIETSLRRYRNLIGKWDRRLMEHGGDPSTLAWENFRPLRLSREEDWSDWLAWLLGNSNCGELAWNLFGDLAARPARELRNPKAFREVLTEDQLRRGDIVLLWPDLGIHIEVKVGDEQFSKTLETGQKLRAKHPVREWRDVVLIPRESACAWEECPKADGSPSPGIKLLFWEDVSCGLRRCLWMGCESAAWRVWAWSLCGAIERNLLGLTRHEGSTASFGQLNALMRWTELLESGKGIKG